MVRQIWSSWRASLKRSYKMQFRRVGLRLIGPPNQVMTKSNFGPISQLPLHCKTPKWRQELIYGSIRVAEVAREHGWHPPKSLDSDENFKPEHTLFCRKLRFVAIYALFGDLWAKKVPFWVKNSVSWARCALIHVI